MRVGFDVSQTGKGKAGCGYLADSLIRAFVDLPGAPEFVLYPTFGDIFWDVDWARGTFQHPQRRWPPMLEPENWEESRRFWQQPPADMERRLGSPDLIHANNFFCPRGLKVARLVWTLHDVLFLEHPEWTTEANRLGCFHGSFDASLRADFIVANSNYSRNRFQHFFPHYPSSRIAVAHLASRFRGCAAAPATAAPAGLTPGGYWLTVGTLEPRKNLAALLAAWRRFPNPPKLVFTGRKGWLMEEFERLTAGLDVLATGYVDDLHLQWLYENCGAFVFPSRAEGFGLPVLEALSCGAPVACSQTTALPEVAGDAALYFDPADLDSLLNALETMRSEPGLRERLRAAGRRRAEEFSWDNTARRVLEVYEETMKRPRRE